MSRSRRILSALFLLSICFLIAGKPSYAYAEESTTICKGVFIDAVDVSGMTRDQAKAAVEEYIKSIQDKQIAVRVLKEVVYSTVGELGYSADPEEDIDKALSLGKSGNLIKRYKDLKDIEQGNVVYPLTFQYDEGMIKDMVINDVSAFNIAPVNASVSRKNGKFIYTDHVVGSKVNVDETTRVIEATLNQWNRQDVIVDAVVEDDMPVYTKDIVEQCNTILGEFTTEYASSAEGRAANLANGARLINNAVLYPGDVFSAYDYLSPFTEENGYFVAGAYLQGKVIDSVGGGACQVTTTLYNAVLFSELEVVERQSHSMTISYVDLSRDAAIAGTSKNFKFKNNTDVPILIEASTKDRKITFKIWGHETRDTKNRKIKFESVIVSQTNPPADIVTKDPTKPSTYKEVTTPAHTGYKAELYKIVYENGVETSRTLINKSNYQAAARCITVGTKVDKPDPNAADTGKEDKSGKTDNTGKTNNSGKTTDPQVEEETTAPDNLDNPDNQLQGDIWGPDLDTQISGEE